MKQPVDSPTFCILPWIHVNSSVSGRYRPCCNSHADWNINDADISFKDAFFNSKEMQKVREDMVNGKMPDACKICYETEQKGGLSPRHTYTVDKFKKHIDPNADEKLKYLDLRFDNTCNLACRMCDPVSSNQLYESVWWYAKNDKMLPEHWSSFAGVKEKDMTKISHMRKQYVADLIDDIEYFKVTGGEPFISKDFLEVLDLFIEKDKAKNIVLSITTNGTKFVKNVLDRLKHFKGLDLNVSVDGTGGIYEYIRYPFKWDKWNERFIEFLTFADKNELYKNKHFRVRTSTIITPYNWLNGPELYNHIKDFSKQFPWLIDINFIPRIDFNLHARPKQSGVNIQWLPNNILDLGLEKWKTTDYRDIKYFEKFVTESKKISHDIKKWKQQDFKYMTTTLDDQRNQSFAVLGKEMTEFINAKD